MDIILSKEIRTLINEIIEVTDYIYQQKMNTGLMKLDLVLGNVVTVIDKLYSYKAMGTIDFDEQIFTEALKVAMNAIEEKDYVMLADVLYYEVAERLEQICEI